MTARFDSIADLHGSMPEIPRVASGVSTEALALLTTEPGAVIVERWLGDEMLSHVNTEIDGWFGRNTDDGPPASGSDLYDLFLGHRTLRLHGLAHKLPYTGARLSVGGWPGGCVRSRYHAANLGLAYIGHAASPLRELLGGGVHDASSRGGGILGLVDGRTPRGDV